MTEQEWINLGRRAAACRGWRWMPGMSLIRRKTGPAGGTGLRPTQLRVALTCGHPCDPFACVTDVDRLPRPCPPDPHWVPDFRDPATLGCLLALVREAKGDPCWQVLCLGDEVWSIEGADYPTEGEAHVAALEAAGEQ